VPLGQHEGSRAGRSSSVGVGSEAAARSAGRQRFFGAPGQARSHQEAVGGDGEGGVMMETAPVAPLVMTETEFLLQFLIVPLEAPAQLDQQDQFLERDALWQRREPVFGGFGFREWPLDHQPLLGMHLVTMGGPDTHADEARDECAVATFAPLDAPPGAARQLMREALHIDRLMRAAAAQVRPGATARRRWPSASS